MKRCLLLASGFWCIAFVGGFIFGYYELPVPASARSTFQADSGTAVFVEVLSRNLLVVAVLIAGFLTGGLTTVLQLSLVAAQAGVLAAVGVRQWGVAWTMRAMLPHGAIEVPALVIGASAGLMGAAHLWVVLKRPGSPAISVRPCAFAAICAVLGVALGALLEAWVTPFLVRG